MSEINSIANGTFTIGQTSATNFVAGNGIKIDEPSAGTVRIGNDETVLYSGSFIASTGSYFNVNESVNNFEKVAFQYGRNIDSQSKTEQTFITNANAYNLFYFNENENSTQINLYVARLLYANNNLRFTVNSQVVKTFTDSNHGQNTTSPMTITKIVGINRISGSNA